MLNRFKWGIGDFCLAVSDSLDRWYQNLWACKRGKHRMKISGCMYCGEGGSQRIVVYI